MSYSLTYHLVESESLRSRFTKIDELTFLRFDDAQRLCISHKIQDMMALTSRLSYLASELRKAAWTSSIQSTK